MARINVLHVVNALQDSSITQIIEHIAGCQEPNEFAWHIGSLSGLGDEAAGIRALDARVIDLSKPHNGGGNAVELVREYVVAEQIHIVHSHTPRSIIVVARALGRNKGPVHLATKHLLFTIRDRRWGLIYVLLDRLSLYLPHHLIVLSHNMYRQLLGFPGIGAKRVTLIPNATDCDLYYVPAERDACRSELGVSADNVLFGFTGRLERMKRVDALLESFALVLKRHPKARLVIAGMGQESAALESLATHLGVAHAVTWLGFRRDVPRILSAIDVYVQPSLNEGMSLSILEAMAAGKAVVATDVGGTAEVITDGQTGILVSTAARDALVAAMLDLLDHPAKREAIALAARERVVRDFGVSKMVDGYHRLYRALA